MKHGNQKTIAKASGLSESYTSELINRKKRPSWQTAKRLIQAVPGTTIEIWMEGTPEEIREAIKNAQHSDTQSEAAA